MKFRCQACQRHYTFTSYPPPVLAVVGISFFFMALGFGFGVIVGWLT